MPEYSNPEPAWAWLARIRKVQGRKGEVVADLLTDFPEKFSERKRVWLLSEDSSTQTAKAAHEVDLQNSWLYKSGHTREIVLHFGGVDSIEAAEKLRGLVVAIPKTERVPLGEDEVYVSDLIGCTLVDLTPQPERIVGAIEDVDRAAGPVALLVVKAAGTGEEILIPFAKAYLLRIDIEGKRIEMALPEGLLEIQVGLQ